MVASPRSRDERRCSRPAKTAVQSFRAGQGHGLKPMASSWAARAVMGRLLVPRDMVCQEIYSYLLTQYAISVLICEPSPQPWPTSPAHAISAPPGGHSQGSGV
jgi:hypothetical protein